MALNPDIKVINNTGEYDPYTNACLWISIFDYLKRCRAVDIGSLTFGELRQTYGSEIGLTQEFVRELHDDNIRDLADAYDLRIDFYYLNREGEFTFLSPHPAYHIGNGRNVVPILAFGDHFVLITMPTILRNCPGLTGIEESEAYVPKVDNNNDGVFEEVASEADIVRQIEEDEELARQLDREEYKEPQKPRLPISSRITAAVAEAKREESDVELARRLQEEYDERLARELEAGPEFPRLPAAEAEPIPSGITAAASTYQYTMYDLVVKGKSTPITGEEVIEKMLTTYGITDPNIYGPRSNLSVDFSITPPPAKMNMNGQNTRGIIDFKVKTN